MSRLNTMSPEAIRQILSVDSDSSLICLLTIYGSDEVTPILRLCDNFVSRISETADEVLYGVVSRSNTFTFLPLRITPPSEDKDSPPRCSIALGDVTRHITPVIRSLTAPPKVKLEWVLSKTPDVVEVSFDDLYITNFQYNAQQVIAELSVIELSREPMPAHSFTPVYFPGLF